MRQIFATVYRMAIRRLRGMGRRGPRVSCAGGHLRDDRQSSAYHAQTFDVVSDFSNAAARDPRTYSARPVTDGEIGVGKLFVLTGGLPRGDVVEPELLRCTVPHLTIVQVAGANFALR